MSLASGDEPSLKGSSQSEPTVRIDKPRRRHHKSRIDGLRWGVGLIAAFIGALMLVSPHQFNAPVYALLRPNLPIWGTAFLLSGAGMLGLIVLRPNRYIAYLLHFLAGVEFLILAGAVASAGSMTGLSNFSMLGIGTLVGPFLDSPNSPSKEIEPDRRTSLLPIVVGVGSILSGLTLLLLPGYYAGPLYDDIRSLLPWYCFAFLGSGALLVIVEILRSLRSLPAALVWFSHVFAGGTLLAFFVGSSVPLRAWIGIAYYGGFGSALIVYPWLREQVARIDVQSIQSRFAYTLGLATGIPLIYVVALVGSLPTSSPVEATTAMNTRDVAFVVLLLVELLAVSAGVFAARWLARPLESLALAADLFARGGKDEPLPESRITEVASLSRSFSEMRNRLATRTLERENLMGELRQTNELLSSAVARATEQAEQTERRAAELSAVLDSMADGLVIYDLEGRVVRVNASAESILGVIPVDDEGALAGDRPLADLKHSNGGPLSAAEMPVDRALRGETVRNVTVASTSGQGKTTWVSISAAPIQSPAGDVIGVVASLADVTLERELERAREEILSLVSHDLRNPLTVLRGYAQLLQRRFQRAGSGSELSQVEMILRCADRMNSMIQELVESSRLEAGQQKLNLAPTDLGALLASILERVGSLEDRGRLSLEVPEPLPTLQTDPESVERLVVNLLTNALKYSDRTAPVVVRAVAGESEVVVSVIDRGVGIPAAEVPRLFEKFFRAQTGQRSEGLGLGLYISRLIVKGLGGRIEVESEVGKGSTFTFTLPI